MSKSPPVPPEVLMNDRLVAAREVIAQAGEQVRIEAERLRGAIMERRNKVYVLRHLPPPRTEVEERVDALIKSLAGGARKVALNLLPRNALPGHVFGYFASSPAAALELMALASGDALRAAFLRVLDDEVGRLGGWPSLSPAELASEVAEIEGEVEQLDAELSALIDTAERAGLAKVA